MPLPHVALYKDLLDDPSIMLKRPMIVHNTMYRTIPIFFGFPTYDIMSSGVFVSTFSKKLFPRVGLSGVRILDRRLYSHLAGTYALLRRVGAEEKYCVSGALQRLFPADLKPSKRKSFLKDHGIWKILKSYSESLGVDSDFFLHAEDIPLVRGSDQDFSAANLDYSLRHMLEIPVCGLRAAQFGREVRLQDNKLVFPSLHLGILYVWACQETSPKYAIDPWIMHEGAVGKLSAVFPPIEQVMKVNK